MPFCKDSESNRVIEIDPAHAQRPIPTSIDLHPAATPAFLNEPFQIITADEHIIPRMQYPALGMKAAEPRCILRASAADHLRAASRMLPTNLRLVIWDAWRPFALQQELYDLYRTQIIEEFELDKMPKAEQDSFIARYVAIPCCDRDMPPAHTTGGAIDLSLAFEDGEELPMGTPFDSFSPKTATAWFEDNRNETDEDRAAQRAIRDNRRLLYNIMSEAGFTNLESEWWHYDFGNANWAAHTGKSALYRGCFEADELGLNS